MSSNEVVNARMAIISDATVMSNPVSRGVSSLTPLPVVMPIDHIGSVTMSTQLLTQPDIQCEGTS